MIRGAQNFIYVETQYFMGSAYSWLKNHQTSCDHIIPAEIAQKLSKKSITGKASWLTLSFQCFLKEILEVFQFKYSCIGRWEQLKWCTKELQMLSRKLETGRIQQVNCDLYMNQDIKLKSEKTHKLNVIGLNYFDFKLYRLVDISLPCQKRKTWSSHQTP